MFPFVRVLLISQTSEATYSLFFGGLALLFVGIDTYPRRPPVIRPLVAVFERDYGVELIADTPMLVDSRVVSIVLFVVAVSLVLTLLDTLIWNWRGWSVQPHAENC
jgi:hypothetical protein